MEIKTGLKKVEPKILLRKIIKPLAVALTSAVLAACSTQVQSNIEASPTSLPSISEPLNQEQPFFSAGEIMTGDNWESAVTGLFKNLYPDFAGYGSLANYSAVIGETRLGRSESPNNFTCVVFPNKLSAEQGVDLLYGDGAGDPDNLLGPLWAGQSIAAGKTDSISSEMNALECGDEYWEVVANRDYSTTENSQTINLGMTRRKIDENGHGLTNGLANFRFYNGEFNNWQGEWEVSVNGQWLPASRLREKLQNGINFNNAINQLENEVKQQSNNRLVDPKGLRGTARDSRMINSQKQASLRGYSTKPRA